MADQVVDSLIVEIRMRTEALERGLSAAEARIDSFTQKSTNSAKQQASAAKASAQEQSASYAMVAAAATAAFAVIVSAVKSGIEAANQYTSALTGLRSVAEGTGQDFGVVKGGLNVLTADGLIPASDAATSLKNLLMRGFEAGQAVEMLNRLKDSAAFGRQASLTMGEAVRSATEGLKNENSILVDNAGVTKNVSVMWKEYAQQIGKSVDSLTTAEKRQAEYNGIMQETRFQVGDATKYAATFAGTQAEVAAATLRTEQAFGRAVQSGLQPFAEALISLLDGLGQFIDQNPELVAGLTAGAAAFVAIIALVGAYKTVVALATAANISFNASLGVIGLIAGVAAAVVGLAAASTNAAQSAAKLTQELQEGVAAARQEQAALREYQALATSRTATEAELAAARDKIIEQSPELVTGYTAEGDAILAGDEAIQTHIEQLDAYIEMQREAIRASADATLAENAQQRQKAIDDEKQALAAYNKELAQSQLWSDRAAAMKDAGIGAMEFDGLTVYLDEVETRLLGINGRLAEYKQAWLDARQAQGEADASDSTVNMVLMQDYIDMMGQLSEVKQYTAEQTMAYALQEQMSMEEFIALLQTRMNSESYMLAMERQMAQAAAENSEAVKAWADSEKNLDNIRKANTAVAEAKKIKTYADTVKQGQKNTKEYGEAVKALAKHFGVSEEAIEANIDAFDVLAGQSLNGATAAQEKLRASLQAAIADLKATGVTAAATVADLQALLAIFDKLGADTTTSSGGGGGTRKKAWEEELEMIDRVMEADAEYAQAYLEHIDSLLQNDRLSKSERKRLERERVYAQQAVDGELEQAHIDYLKRLLRRERLNADQRLDIEQQLFEAKRAMQERELESYNDFADALVGAITARAEAQRDAALSSLQDQISAVSEWESKQTAAIRKIMDARIDAINAQIRSIDDLMKAQDRADKDEEDADKLRRLQAQLAYEKDERNKQKLLEQIAALETSINERKEREKLEDQKQALKDQQDTIRTEAEAQIEIIQQQAEREQETLNRRLKAAQQYWDKRLSLENIQQEAILFLQNATQEQIIALLQSYAPEYLGKGQLLGSQFYGGLKPKIDAIISEISRMRAEAVKPIVITTIHRTIYETAGVAGGRSGSTGSSISAAIASFAAAPDAAIMRMASNVQQSVNAFADRSIRPAAMAAQSAISTSRGRNTTQSRSVKVEQTVIMQQPVPSPYQNARALRRESERLAKLI